MINTNITYGLIVLIPLAIVVLLLSKIVEVLNLKAIDALIAVVGGDSVFKGYRSLVDEDFRFGFEHRFLGQVRLVRLGERFARNKSSFIFSRGFLSHYPNRFR